MCKINDWSPKSENSISYLQEIWRSNFEFWDKFNNILEVKIVEAARPHKVLECKELH